MSESFVNEELDRAYENIGLLASDVWNFDVNEASYQRSNLNLWIQLNEIEQKFAEEEPPAVDRPTFTDTHTVKDSIPFSRLASYGDYAYSKEREKYYCDDDDLAHFVPNLYLKNRTNIEVWMLPEVEEEFRRITNCSSPR